MSEKEIWAIVYFLLGCVGICLGLGIGRLVANSLAHIIFGVYFVLCLGLFCYVQFILPSLRNDQNAEFIDFFCNTWYGIGLCGVGCGLAITLSFLPMTIIASLRGELDTVKQQLNDTKRAIEQVQKRQEEKASGVNAK